MDVKELTDRGVFINENERYIRARISLFEVMKCNFNDERLIESEYVLLSDISGKPYRWFDPFFGRAKGESVKAAIAYLSSDRFVLLIKKGDKTEALETASHMTHYISEDSEESTFLSAQIELFSR